MEKDDESWEKETSLLREKKQEEYLRERAKRKSSNFYHCWCKEGYICQEKKRIYEMTFRNGKSKIFCKPVS